MLGELLLERLNYNIMMKYITSKHNLKVSLLFVHLFIHSFIHSLVINPIIILD